ncbi:MAG TPA: NAD(P)-binding domain-containing protein, partial [Flexilinea sp.]|nr:NAD(P)-binding domain-containing protein [Flexilinea sp.]
MTIDRIAVIGQGYVGLPLALSFALHGCHVIGVDSDPDVCSNLKKGITAQTETYQGQSIQTILQTMLQKGTYQITDNGAEAVRRSEVIVLTVGIPIESGVPVYEYFEAACNTIGENLQKGSLILIRSTVIPGTTENFCKPIFEKKSGMKAG